MTGYLAMLGALFLCAVFLLTCLGIYLTARASLEDRRREAREAAEWEARTRHPSLAERVRLLDERSRALDDEEW